MSIKAKAPMDKVESRGVTASRKILTIRQASIEIGVDPEAGYLRQLARSGELPAFRLPEGHGLLIWRKDFDKWAKKKGYSLTA